LLQTRHFISQIGSAHVPDFALVITTEKVHGAWCRGCPTSPDSIDARRARKQIDAEWRASSGRAEMERASCTGQLSMGFSGYLLAILQNKLGCENTVGVKLSLHAIISELLANLARKEPYIQST
jgi:hypothetical protein